MILKRLYELALRTEGLPPPNYDVKDVHWIVQLRADGSMRGAYPQYTGERLGRRIPVPYHGRSGTKAPPFLVVDNAKYVLGLAEDDCGAWCHTAYIAGVDEAAEKLQLAELRALSRWLHAGGPARLRTEHQDILPAHRLGFEVDGVFVTDLPAVRAFLAPKSGGEDAWCLVTGKKGPVLELWPVVSGVKGTNSKGVAFSSFEMDAAKSYGLPRSGNSPISASAGYGAAAALNWLLRSRQHRRIVGASTFVWWTREEVPFDPMAFLEKPSDEAIAALLSEVVGTSLAVDEWRKNKQWTAPGAQSTAPQAVADNDFYFASFTGNPGRIVLRGFVERQLSLVKATLLQWARATEITSADGAGITHPGLLHMSSSLYAKEKDMPAHVPTALLRSALEGTPLPVYLLGLAVRRNQAMQGPFAIYNRQRYICVDRLALIKALLQQREEHALDSLNRNHPDAAYHCGRLMAALERIQRAALGDINATVVDRYYGAACSSPGSILGNLVNDAQAHLGKLRRDHRDYYHQLQLEEILSAIGPEFPRTLSLPRQGLFALGFYHQKAQDRADAAARKETNTGDHK